MQSHASTIIVCGSMAKSTSNQASEAIIKIRTEVRIVGHQMLADAKVQLSGQEVFTWVLARYNPFLRSHNHLLGCDSCIY